MKKRIICFVLSLIMIGSFLPAAETQAASSVKVTSIKNTKNGIVLKWKNSKKASGYRIYRSEDGGKFSSYDITNKKTYTDPNVETGTTYQYKVRPYKIKRYKRKYIGGSPASAKITSVPRIVMDVVHHAYDDRVVITWVKNYDASSYMIYRSTDKVNWQKIDIVPYDTDSYEDIYIEPGVKYYYKVQELKFVDGKMYEGIKSAASTSYDDPINIYKKNKINIKTSKLHPYLQFKLKKALKKCNEKGIYLIITEGLRTKKYQDSLYAQGRTKPGAIVTYAKGKSYSSQHQWGIAFDIAINGPKKVRYNANMIAKAAKIIKTVGLAWGGDWNGFSDMPHFYLKTWGATPYKLKKLYKNPTRFKKTWKRTVKSATPLYASTKLKSGPVLATIPKNTKVSVYYYKSKGYAKVVYNKMTGYVYTSKFKKI